MSTTPRLEPQGDVPSHEEFRAVGMTAQAAQFPRSEVQVRMFAAFLNVPVEKLPVTFRYFANAHMRDAWERVRNAALPASDHTLVPREFLDFLRHAPVGSGTCCCGDDMEKHSDPMSCGHSPVDMWDHALAGWLKQIEAGAPEKIEKPIDLEARERMEAAITADYENDLRDMTDAEIASEIVSAQNAIDEHEPWLEALVTRQNQHARAAKT